MARPGDPVWLEGATAHGEDLKSSENRWRVVFDDLADGQVRALDELYDLAATDVYRLALWRTGSTEDAEDVVHDVFVRLAEKSATLASIKRPRTWLLTVARRRAIDLVRRRAVRKSEPIEGAPLLVAATEDLDRRADAAAVSSLVARLPVKQREVVLLRHFAGCSFSEIGRITGVPTFTAASRYRLAIARLRRLLERTHDPSK